MPVDLSLVLYRDFSLYTNYGFLKWKMIRGNGFMEISSFIFVFPKFGGRIYTNFPVFPMNYVSVYHGVCKVRKITKFPILLLVKSCHPSVDTLKQISNG